MTEGKKENPYIRNFSGISEIKNSEKKSMQRYEVCI